ncbi:MAG: tetratricopeptide (TPR) repeat protein [Verrucomicrobiales bacterium]|jgi:tetratricopeptide (TPR) repeat protein
MKNLLRNCVGWLAFALTISALAQEEARVWTPSGRSGVTAIFVKHDGANVVLRTPDGKEHTVPLARLSKADRDYVASQKTAPGSEPAPAAADFSGGLGEIGRALTDEQTAALAAALDQSIAEKSWEPYNSLVEPGARQLAAKLKPELGVSSYLNVFSEPTFAKLIAQERFLSRVPEAGLTALLSSGEEGEPFVRWLFERTDAMEAFIVALDPQDDPVKAIEIWRSCWEAVPETQAEFANVAIACALVFDKKKTVKTTVSGPKPEIDPVERCREFVAASKKGSLHTQLEEMPIHELVWVVCADVSSADLEWARKEVRLSQKNLGRAYPMIEYLMERATDNTNPYETYALEEIKEVGGVCRDQAHFATNVARAHGVPAFVVSGDGDRGRHAWMGYKLGRGEWDSNTGRYRGYRTGTSRSPQTNQPVREQLFALWNETDFNDPSKFQAAHRLIFWSEIYRDLENQLAEVALARMASEAAPHNPPALQRWIDALESYPETNEAMWKEVLADIRRSFREHPDMLAKAAELEIKNISIEENLAELVSAIEAERRNIMRKDSERSDLLVVLYRREADLAIHQKDFDEVLAIYKKAFKSLAGDVPAFKGLAKDLVACADQAVALSVRPAAIKIVEDYFEKDINTGGGDYFRQQSEAGVKKMIDQLKAKS